MFSEDHSEPTSFKKPKIASLGGSFDDCNNDVDSTGDLCENTKDDSNKVQNIIDSVEKENINNAMENAQENKETQSFSSTPSYLSKRKFNLFSSSNPEVSLVRRNILAVETQDILESHYIQESQDILDDETKESPEIEDDESQDSQVLFKTLFPFHSY